MPTRIRESQSLESVYRPVLNALGRLIRQVNVGRAVEADFEHVMFLLETLPLATDEFGTARLRLLNAKHYRNEQEAGAAAWEIRTVMLQLRAKATARSFAPRRRTPQA